MEEVMKIMQNLSELPPEERLSAVSSAFEDQKRLNKLQALTEKQNYTGAVVMRMSDTGRGWRLHETSQDGADTDVRDAIDRFFAEHDPEEELLQ